jgi:ABC-2 type transport system permease protein
VITEFKLRYQGSALGYLWSLLKPLFLFTILYFVFVHFLKIGEGIPNWPISMLFGIVLWNFFAEVTSNGLNSVVARGDVIRKINFPKYVIVLASSVSALINLTLNFVVIGVFMVISGVDLHWSALLTPLYIVELFVFGVGLAFILSTLFVKLRDVNYIWEILMQALFYGSAIIYPVAIVVEKMGDSVAKVLMMNPITQSIQGARYALIDHSNPTLYSMTDNILLNVAPIMLVVVVAVAGGWMFKKKSPYFAEEV